MDHGDHLGTTNVCVALSNTITLPGTVDVIKMLVSNIGDSWISVLGNMPLFNKLETMFSTLF